MPRSVNYTFRLYTIASLDVFELPVDEEIVDVSPSGGSILIITKKTNNK